MQVSVQSGRVVKITGNKNNPATYGLICKKGQNFARVLYGEERLLYPMKRVGARGEGHFRRISWAEAIEEMPST